MKNAIFATFLFALNLSLQAQIDGSFNCSETFWTVNGSGYIQQWTLAGNTVSGGETILYGFSPGLGWCGAENDYTFYSTSFPDNGIVYYDSTSSGWISISTTVPVLNNGCSGFHQYYLGTSGVFNDMLYYFDGVKLIKLDSLTTSYFTVADVAVDSAGRAWVFTGESITYATSLDVYDKHGKVLSYALDFDTYNGYGSFFLNNTLYVGLGSGNSINPNTLMPVLINGGFAQPGTPIPFADENYYDMANCRGSGISAVSGVDAGDLKVYPNPTAGEVRIEGPDVIDVDVWSVDGRNTAREMSKGAVDLSGLPDGIYFLHITTGKGQYIRKIIKSGD